MLNYRFMPNSNISSMEWRSNGRQSRSLRCAPGADRGRYSNNMLVSHTREEFILDFLLTAPNGTQLVSRVMVSPGHMKRVLSALADNMHKYEANFGEVVAPEVGHPQFH